MALKDGQYRIIEFVTYTMENIFNIRYFPVGNFYKQNQFYSPLSVFVPFETRKSERPAQTQATNANKDSLHTDFAPR